MRTVSDQTAEGCPASAQSFRVRAPEWPTLGLIALTYAVWGAATAFAADLGPWLAIPLAALATTLHSSLQHEVIHGHPLRSERASAALVFPPIGLAIAYERFRDLHLAHHRDEVLTDPYDDPETNYLDPAVWVRLPRPVRWLLGVNNTLLGRMTLGPAIGLACFWRQELRAALAGDRAVRRAWALHGAGLVPVVAWHMLAGSMAVWEIMAAAYLGLSILRIRTFLEHRAHERAAGRSVIIEDRGPLSLLFLNNNFHALHHAAPRVAWYDLPRLYRRRREEILRRNRGYRYASYRDVFRQHFLTAKDPVAHPLRPLAVPGEAAAAAGEHGWRPRAEEPAPRALQRTEPLPAPEPVPAEALSPGAS